MGFPADFEGDYFVEVWAFSECACPIRTVTKMTEFLSNMLFDGWYGGSSA
jgi:hypothetical protein